MKTFKVRLVPNNHQRTRLFQFAGAARFAYNWALQKEREAYAAGEKFIGSNDLRKAFTVLRNSDQYSWLKTKRGDYSFYQDTSKIQITSTHVKLEAIAN